MTVRELQTLALVAEGKPYGVIAEHLHVSYKTVANTCTQLKAKLGVRTLPELMRIAIQHLPSVAARPPNSVGRRSTSAARTTAGSLWRTARLPWAAGPAGRPIGATAMTKAAGLTIHPAGRRAERLQAHGVT